MLELLAKIRRATADVVTVAYSSLGMHERLRRRRGPLWLTEQPLIWNDQAIAGMAIADTGAHPKQGATGNAFGIGALHRFKTETLDPMFADMRTQHLKEISLEEDVLTEEQKLANQQFVFTSMGVVSIGTCMLFFQPLVLLHIPVFLMFFIPIFQEAYQDVVKKRRVTATVADAALGVGSLTFTVLNPALLLYGAIGAWVYTLTNKITAQAKDGTRKHLTNLMGEQPKKVWRLQDGIEVEIPFEAIQANDLIVVDAAQMIPVDGLIQEGMAAIDQHMLTGEAQPVEKSAGDPVFAATVVLVGRIIVQVQKTGEETAAAQVGKMLIETAEFTSSVELRGKAIADRAALPTLVLSGAFFPWIGPSRTLAILLSGVGYNMKIIGPLSVLNYLQRIAQQGILIKDGRALEHIRQVDTVVFDKTGTLTLDQPHVGKIHCWGAIEEASLLRYAAAAEHRQGHPIAKAILQEAAARQLQLPTVSAAAYEVGYGIQVTIEGKRIRVGSERYMAQERIRLPDDSAQIVQNAHAQGHSLVYIASDDSLAGAIELEPTVRPEAQQIVEILHGRGIETYIISGDHEAPTRALAEKLGVKQYFAETRPEQKADHIVRLQEAGKFVCFVGDGINDAIALKQAQISISLRGATTIATDTAQIIMMDQTLTQLPLLFTEAEAFESNMRTNLVTTVLPGMAIIGGALSGVVGYGASIAIFNVGLGAGVVNAMLPRLRAA